MIFRLIGLGAFFLVVFAATRPVQIVGQNSTLNTASALSIELDEKALTLGQGCPGGTIKGSPDSTVDVLVKTSSSSDQVQYRFDVTAGYIIGSGKHVQWNLDNVAPGSYVITVSEFLNGKQNGESQTTTLTVEYLTCCGLCDCGTIVVLGPPRAAKPNTIVTFTASVSGGTWVPIYNWTVENGLIVSGQGTPSIEVRVKKSSKSNLVKATVELGGLNPSCACPSTESPTIRIASP